MPRKAPADPTDKDRALQKKSNKMIRLIRHYKVITPLFGGGVQTNEVDPQMPVRVAGIRGHLRFWWRATRGCFGDGDEGIEALYKAEEEIWGSASKTSAVSVHLDKIHKGQAIVDENRQTELSDFIDKVMYGAFPLMEESHATPFHRKITFSLAFTFPESVAEDMKAALWAWETFGGIGARTRRGFGAIHCHKCEQVDLNDETETLTADSGWVWKYEKNGIETAIKKHLHQFVKEGTWHSHLPHLSRDISKIKVKSYGQKDQENVLKELLNALKTFRQSRPQSPYGRNDWPEPDAIRSLARRSRYPTENDERPYVYNPPIIKFPRADFGLPIIFEFNHYKDPTQTSLEGCQKNRMGSPLILRPLQIDSENILGMALVLEGPRANKLPGGLVLKKLTRTPPQVEATLESDEARKIQENHPTFNGNTDILQAFLDTL